MCRQRVGKNFFCDEPGDILGFLWHMGSVACIQFFHDSSKAAHRQGLNECVWLCSTLFTKIGSRLDLAHKLQFADSRLDAVLC